jgi:hypothetical protein
LHVLVGHYFAQKTGVRPKNVSGLVKLKRRLVKTAPLVVAGDYKVILREPVSVGGVRRGGVGQPQCAQYILVIPRRINGGLTALATGHATSGEEGKRGRYCESEGDTFFHIFDHKRQYPLT